MRFKILFFFILIGSRSFSQSITISGETTVPAGSQKYYSADFSYRPGSSTTLVWTITGGTIVDQGVNPNQPVWCIVQWNTTPQNGLVRLSDNGTHTTGQLATKIKQLCVTANAGSNKTICLGSSTTIGTPALNGYSYYWTPGTGLNNPAIAQPTAQPTATTIYTLHTSSVNLINNGTFENGNSGFHSDYPSTFSGTVLGFAYSSQIAYNLYCNSFPYAGNYMLWAAGEASFNNAALRIWYNSYSVISNADYLFKGYFSCPNDPVDFNINIIGDVTGTTTTSFSGLDNCSHWRSFNIPWNAGINSSVTIEFRFAPLSNAQSVLTLDNLNFSLDCAETQSTTTVNVLSNSPTVSPAGPITYYNQYESPNNVVLTSSAQLGNQWYKNNVAIPGATGQTYTITGDGSTTYTDYYKCVTPCGTSNVVTFNYHGIMGGVGYPVTVTQGGCASTMLLPNYIQLNAPSLGTGTTYSYSLKNNPTCYSISSSGHLSAASCNANEGNGVYVKSSLNGAETYMFYYVSINNGCRMINNSNNETASLTGGISINKTSFTPNPASNSVIIKSKNEIQALEFYDALGRIVKKHSFAKSDVISVNIEDLKSGIYNVKVIGKQGSEVLKLIVQH